MMRVHYPNSVSGAVAAVIHSMRSGLRDDAAALLPPLAVSPPVPPFNRAHTKLRPSAHRSKDARATESRKFPEPVPECGSESRRKSDPGPPPSRRLVCVQHLSLKQRCVRRSSYVFHRNRCGRYDKPWRFMARMGREAGSLSPLRGGGAVSPLKLSQMSSASSSPTSPPSAAAASPSSFSSFITRTTSTPPPVEAKDSFSDGVKQLSSLIWGSGVYSGASVCQRFRYLNNVT
jgi:hypothetical protein